MREKRRDNRGRILRNGESQRQDGRYAYKYKNLNGDTKFVCSWRLDKNDRTPPGKAREPSLREKEKKTQQDLFNQVVPNGGNLTVLELVQKYLGLKVNVRHNTRANYKFVTNIIEKEAFGKMRIDKVKLSDAKAWLIKLQKDGRGYSTIHAVRGVVWSGFGSLKNVYLPLVVGPVVRGIDLLPDLLLLSDIIYHKEPRYKTTYQKQAMPKSRCGAK